MPVDDLIDDLDYTAIRNKIIRVIGTGDGNRGYGQAIKSVSVSEGQIITKAQWDSLRWDIYNALFHQTGNTPALIEVAANSVIRYGASNPNTQYDTQSNTADTNRFDLGIGQFSTEAGTSTSRSASWASQVSTTVTVTFSTAEQARFFFNSGGKIRFSSSRTGGASTDQNASWASLLSSVGTQAFAAVTPTVNFYTLTSSYQTWYSSSPLSSPYSGNTFTIEALCDVANNSLGTARILTFRIVWTDTYIDINPSPPDDIIDGTLALTIDQIRAVGNLQPSGTFSIVSPVYSADIISGS
jgi:hypothetical protein